MPAIGQNGKLLPGQYVVRFPAEQYTQLRSACWYEWFKPHQAAGHGDITSRPWDPPALTGIGFADESALAAAWLYERNRSSGVTTGPYALPPNMIGLDRDVYQTFYVSEPVDFWDYRGDCAFAAWPWDGVQDPELAATGAQVQPYNELDAASDAVKQTASKAAEVAAAAPAALGAAAQGVADVTPWWVKVGLGVVGLGVVAYAIRAVRP